MYRFIILLMISNSMHCMDLPLTQRVQTASETNKWYDLDEAKKSEKPLHYIAEQLKKAESNDHIFQNNLKNPDFCVGLVQQVRRDLLDLSDETVSYVLGVKHKIKAIEEQHLKHQAAKVHYGLADVYEEKQYESYTKSTDPGQNMIYINRNWVYEGGQFEREGNLLELAVQRKDYTLVAELLNTNIFDINWPGTTGLLPLNLVSAYLNIYVVDISLISMLRMHLEIQCY